MEGRESGGWCGERGEAAALVMAMASMVVRVGKVGWEWAEEEERKKERKEVLDGGFKGRFPTTGRLVVPWFREVEIVYAKVFV